MPVSRLPIGELPAVQHDFGDPSANKAILAGAAAFDDRKLAQEGRRGCRSLSTSDPYLRMTELHLNYCRTLPPYS